MNSNSQRFSHSSGELVPRRCTLAGFAEEISDDGVDVRTATPLAPILVRTENSLYRVVPLQPGDSRVLITGGHFFPEPTEARLAGSTFGGSLLKLAWIGVGMHLEIHTGAEPVITSRVRAITAGPDPSSTAALQ